MTMNVSDFVDSDATQYAVSKRDKFIQPDSRKLDDLALTAAWAAADRECVPDTNTHDDFNGAIRGRGPRFEEVEDNVTDIVDVYTSGGDAETSYNIEIVFEGDDWTDTLQDAFTSAADYLSQIILGDVADVGDIDDISISASLEDIDGEGNVLGQAGPTFVRSDGYLPMEGIMEFDIADAETYEELDLWDDIVFHEMLHTLGFGSVWEYVGLTDGTVDGGDIVFTGEMANAAYETEFAAESAADGFDFGVPIETEGGDGTAGGHWDEDTFVDEIMTGYVDDSNYLSEMTVASLEDMGYDTILDNPNDANDLTGTWPSDDPLTSLIA